MGRTQKQRKKVLPSPGFFKDAQVLENRGSHIIDTIAWHTFLTLDSKVEDFLNKCFQIRKSVGIPKLNPKEDLLSIKNHSNGYGPFIPKGLCLGVGSHFLYEHQNVQEIVYKLIYNNILIPFKFSHNIYPAIEYIVLYKDFINTPIFANPCLFDLFIHKNDELFRTPLSIEDINFLREKNRLYTVKTSRASKAQVKELEKRNLLIDKLSRNKARPPKNAAFRIAAFNVFSEMKHAYKENFLSELEEKDDLSRFIKNQIEVFKEEYKKLKDSGFSYEEKLSDKSIHNRLKKLHLEYKKLCK